MMATAERQGSIPRSAGLIVLAALAVHQLRYLLAFGSGTHESLSAQGHAYLLHSMPILTGFAVAVIAAGLLRAKLAGPRARQAAPARTRLYGYALAILTVYSVQETMEGALSAGHASGVEAVLGSGGWLALPLALLLAGVCALLDGGLARLELLVAGRPTRGPRRRAPRRSGVPRRGTSVAIATRLLAFGFARRPPPALS